MREEERQADRKQTEREKDDTQREICQTARQTVTDE